MNGVSNCANAAKGSLTHSQVAQTNNVTNCSSETGNCDSNNLDVTDEIFTHLFQNVETCQYLSLNSSLPCDFNDSKLFLLHLNIRSSSKNYDNLIEFLTNVPLRPHIISLTETKIKDEPVVNITILGYTFLHVNSVSNAGGVGVHVSDLLQFKKLSFEASFSGFERIWINLTYPGTDINYVVGTVYRYPNSNAYDFMKFLNDILTELNLDHKRFFVLGDMNINTSKRTNCSKDYLNHLLSSNCATNIIKYQLE